MVLRHPYQKLCYINSESKSTSFILAAAGHEITCFSLETGRVISKFTADNTHNLEEKSETKSNSEDGGERPKKRRKREGGEAEKLSRSNSEESVEIVAERQKGQRRRPKPVDSKLPNVSHLISTSDGRKSVAITAEDKSINVLQIGFDGHIAVESKRAMPKRLCALVLTPDEETILAGDKFGDVYSLPLSPLDGIVLQNTVPKRPNEVFKPSATEYTVHTGGNLEALRQQRQQKHLKTPKEGPKFEHKLLLGHVSLLTCVAIVEIYEDSIRKQYILSADRDEHIRVSRGITQAHIIENYCLGHQEFVSVLTILPWAPTLLIAGSGEPSLKVYDWRHGLLKHEEKFSSNNIRKNLDQMVDFASTGRDLNSVAVARIWPVLFDTDQSTVGTHSNAQLILVSLEGLPILLSYIIDVSGRLFYHQMLMFSSNVLDVVVMPKNDTILVSVDTAHQSASVKALRSDELSIPAPFESFELVACNPFDLSCRSSKVNDQITVNKNWEISGLAERFNIAALEDRRYVEVPEEPSNQQQKLTRIYSTLGEFLYGLENLRKKRLSSAIEDDLPRNGDINENGENQEVDSPLDKI